MIMAIICIKSITVVVMVSMKVHIVRLVELLYLGICIRHALVVL